MTKEEAEKTIKAMRKVAKEVMKSDEKILKFLYSTGSYTKKGNLKKAYR